MLTRGPPRGAGTNLPGAIDHPGDSWEANISGHVQLPLSTAATRQLDNRSVLLQDSRQALLKWYSLTGMSGRTKGRDLLTSESESEVGSITEATMEGVSLCGCPTPHGDLGVAGKEGTSDLATAGRRGEPIHTTVHLEVLAAGLPCQ